MEITHERKKEIDIILKNSEESIKKNTVKTVPFSEFLAQQNERSILMDYQYIVENTVSKTMQNYMSENNLFFTLKDLAAIAYNSNMPQVWKMACLEAIASETDDVSLKQQIEELVALEMFQCEKFWEETEHTFYLLHNSRNHELEGLYKKADVAYKEGLVLNEQFKIEKYDLKSSRVLKGYSREGVFKKEVSDLHAEAWQIYDCEGNLMSFYSSETNISDEKLIDLIFNEKRFQNAPIKFPNPFNKGDIVQCISNNIVGVVVTSQKEWEELRNHKNSSEFDFWDYNLIIKPIRKEHNPNDHYHILPISLELIGAIDQYRDSEMLKPSSLLSKENEYVDEYDLIVACYTDAEVKSNMIYTDMTKKAMKLCFDVHKNQLDKSGLPYVFHPFHVAEQLDDEIGVTVALLHDVVEDSTMTFAELSKQFPESVIEILMLLTHNENESYSDYIEKIKTHPVATKVKIADLKHNMDLSRLNVITDSDIKRAEKYKKALLYLEDIND